MGSFLKGEEEEEEEFFIQTYNQKLKRIKR
jgi:hypothetical protein